MRTKDFLISFMGVFLSIFFLLLLVWWMDFIDYCLCSAKLLELAAKHRMNTDTRRRIFCTIMSSEVIMMIVSYQVVFHRRCLCPVSIYVDSCRRCSSCSSCSLLSLTCTDVCRTMWMLLRRSHAWSLRGRRVGRSWRSSSSAVCRSVYHIAFAHVHNRVVYASLFSWLSLLFRKEEESFFKSLSFLRLCLSVCC